MSRQRNRIKLNRLKIIENITKEARPVLVFKDKEIIEELVLPPGTSVITNAAILEGNESEITQKIKDMKLVKKEK